MLSWVFFCKNQIRETNEKLTPPNATVRTKRESVRELTVFLAATMVESCAERYRNAEPNGLVLMRREETLAPRDRLIS